MKTTKKICSFVLLLFMTISSIQAQKGNWNADPADQAKRQTTEMTEKLSLSEKQAEKVGEINLEYAYKMKEARDANQDDDWSAKRETMRQIRKDQNADLKNVMTAAQFEQWEKIQAERRSQRRGRSGKDGPRSEDKTLEKQG